MWPFTASFLLNLWSFCDLALYLFVRNNQWLLCNFTKDRAVFVNMKKFINKVTRIRLPTLVRQPESSCHLKSDFTKTLFFASPISSFPLQLNLYFFALNGIDAIFTPNPGETMSYRNWTWLEACFTIFKCFNKVTCFYCNSWCKKSLQICSTHSILLTWQLHEEWGTTMLPTYLQYL